MGDFQNPAVGPTPNLPLESCDHPSHQLVDIHISVATHIGHKKAQLRIETMQPELTELLSFTKR
tara:strand:+ start:168 stop:359 length:192 start_codon:yes stop_codon:yes gene_type:complete